MTFFAIEAYSDRSLDDNTFELKRISPRWVKLAITPKPTSKGATRYWFSFEHRIRMPDRTGQLKFMHYATLEDAIQEAMVLIGSDANNKEREHVTPFRIVKVENKVGTVVWLDPRPDAEKALLEMNAPGTKLHSVQNQEPSSGYDSSKGWWNEITMCPHGFYQVRGYAEACPQCKKARQATCGHFTHSDWSKPYGTYPDYYLVKVCKDCGKEIGRRTKCHRCKKIVEGMLGVEIFRGPGGAVYYCRGCFAKVGTTKQKHSSLWSRLKNSSTVNG